MEVVTDSFKALPQYLSEGIGGGQTETLKSFLLY